MWGLWKANKVWYCEGQVQFEKTRISVLFHTLWGVQSAYNPLHDRPDCSVFYRSNLRDHCQFWQRFACRWQKVVQSSYKGRQGVWFHWFDVLMWLVHNGEADDRQTIIVWPASFKSYHVLQAIQVSFKSSVLKQCSNKSTAGKAKSVSCCLPTDSCMQHRTGLPPSNAIQQAREVWTSFQVHQWCQCKLHTSHPGVYRQAEKGAITVLHRIALTFIRLMMVRAILAKALNSLSSASWSYKISLILYVSFSKKIS